jgi:hypothetical protein
MDGFYAAFLTGRGGQSVVLFAIKAGKIVGVDVGGLKYAGSINAGSGDGFRCKIRYTIKPGVSLITGPGPVAKEVPVNLTFDLPRNFGEGPVVAIDTPFGPLNAKFQKLADIDI